MNKFFASVMGKKNQVEDIQCPVCGYYCTGKGGIGCIDKPFLVHLTDDKRYEREGGLMSKIDQFFTAVMKIKKHPRLSDVWITESGLIFLSSLNGETSYETRKWFQEHEPEVFDDYLNYCYHELDSNASLTNVFDSQLSIENFYRYLTEYFDEWGYKECVKLSGNENGIMVTTGKICKYPEAEKIVKVEK